MYSFRPLAGSKVSEQTELNDWLWFEGFRPLAGSKVSEPLPIPNTKQEQERFRPLAGSKVSEPLYLVHIDS